LAKIVNGVKQPTVFCPALTACYVFGASETIHFLVLKTNTIVTNITPQATRAYGLTGK
jgi:hypothetical protein